MRTVKEHDTRGEDLLAAYTAGQTFFASARGTLLAEGVRATLEPEDGAAGWASLPERARELVAKAADEPGAIITGAVPFEHERAARLFVPETVRRGAPLDANGVLRHRPQPTPRWQVTHEPPAEGYAAAVAEAVRRFASTPLEKVVLARTVHLTTDPPVDLRQLITALAARDPRGHTFAVDLPATNRTFLGASPELLVGRYGTRVVANPYAGSAARSADCMEDRERARQLLASAKDRHEHAVVVEQVERILRPFCRELTVPAGPELVNTRAMWHLATTIEGELADPATTALDLACALHPTAAVCGTPTDLAYRTIAELEPFDRDCYAGIVGWTDAAGDGEWVIAIRSAEVAGERLRLFAGAGIVEGSTPESEVRETAAKFHTMLDAIGIDAEL